MEAARKTKMTALLAQFIFMNDESIQCVFAHRVEEDSTRSYYVKLRGRPYYESKWIPEATFNEDLKLKAILNKYLRSKGKQVDAEPYYDPEYDIPDCIVDQNENEYLVKYSHLDFDEIVAETDVSSKLLAKHKKRSSFEFPECHSLAYNHPPIPNNSLPLTQYTLFGNDLPLSTVSTLNFLLNSYLQGDSAEIIDDFSSRAVTACIAFVDYLFTNESDIGPYLIVVPHSSINQWYDILKTSQTMTPLCYTGTRKSRENIHQYAFISESDKRLKWHVLITTPDLILSDSQHFNEIHYRAIIVSHPTYPANRKSNVNSLLANYRKYHRIDYYQAQSTKHDVATMELVKFFSSTHNSLTNKLDEDAFIGILNDVKVKVTTDLVKYNCPLNSIQRSVCRSIIFERKDDLLNGIFLPICSAFLYAFQHPFLVFGIEQKLGTNDLIATSTKMSVLNRLIVQCVQAKQIMMIASIYPELLDRLEDFIEEKNLSNLIFLYGYSKQVSEIDVLVIYDGAQEEWKEKLSNYPTNLKKVIKLETNDYRELKLLEACKNNGDDFICRHIAISCFTPSEFAEKDLKAIMEKPLPLNYDPQTSQFVEKEMNFHGFWQTLLNMPPEERPKDNFQQVRSIIKEDRQWLNRERKRFISSLMAFGWGRWDLFIKHSGLRISAKVVENVSRSILRLCNDHFLNHYVEISENGEDLSSSDTARLKLIDLYFESKRLIKRVKLISYLNALMPSLNAFMDSSTSTMPQSKIPEWWLMKHDRALFEGTVKYGFGNYIAFALDPDPIINEIVKKRNLYDFLDNRLESFNESIIQFVKDDISEEANKVTNVLVDGWSLEDQQLVINHMLKFGERIMEVPGKSIEETKALIEEISEQCTSLNKNLIPLHIALRIRKRVKAMNMLNEIVGNKSIEAISEQFYILSRWKSFPRTWDSACEAHFFILFYKLGFGSQHLIFEDEFFHRRYNRSSLPQTVYSDTEFIKRIKLVSQSTIRQVNEDNSSASNEGPRDNYNTLPFELKLPCAVTVTSYIHHLGHIVYDREGFHTEKYIYPAGFKSSRLASSLDRPMKKARWFSEILDVGKEYPIFRIWMEGNSNKYFDGLTPTAPWSAALKEISKKRQSKNHITSISGPEAFLLASPVTAYLIQHLEDADKCAKYEFRNVDSNSSVLAFIAAQKDSLGTDFDPNEIIKSPIDDESDSDYSVELSPDS